MSADEIAGFALRRNGSCLSMETECGPTVQPYYACCAGGSTCVNPYNQVCCTSGNCTTTIVQDPVCADPSWNLYNNGGVDSGYFCCLPSTFGYAVQLGGSNGCGDLGYELQSGEIALQQLSQATSSTAGNISATRKTKCSTVLTSV